MFFTDKSGPLPDSCNMLARAKRMISTYREVIVALCTTVCRPFYPFVFKKLMSLSSHMFFGILLSRINENSLKETHNITKVVLVCQ